MKQFEFTVRDPMGLHARPAGLLAKLAKSYADTVIMLSKGDVSVKATQLMRVLSLNVKQGETVSVTADGPSEDAAITAIGALFQTDL